MVVFSKHTDSSHLVAGKGDRGEIKVSISGHSMVLTKDEAINLSVALFELAEGDKWKP